MRLADELAGGSLDHRDVFVQLADHMRNALFVAADHNEPKFGAVLFERFERHRFKRAQLLG